MPFQKLQKETPTCTVAVIESRKTFQLEKLERVRSWIWMLCIRGYVSSFIPVTRHPHPQLTIQKPTHEAIWRLFGPQPSFIKMLSTEQIHNVLYHSAQQTPSQGSCIHNVDCWFLYYYSFLFGWWEGVSLHPSWTLSSTFFKQLDPLYRGFKRWWCDMLCVLLPACTLEMCFHLKVSII